MTHRYKIHYTRDEARLLLPQVRQWLRQLARLREQLREGDQRLSGLMATGGDAGGEPVNQWVKAMGETRELLLEFERREIMLKDLDRGLVDFPAIIGGREVFLCWEQDEEDVEFWHDLNSGYAGREPL